MKLVKRKLRRRKSEMRFVTTYTHLAQKIIELPLGPDSADPQPFH